MKVLSYLEMINDNDDYHFEFLKFMESKGFSIIGNQYYKGVAKFYSQPFKPELITELFEGWVTDATDESEYPYANYWYDSSSIISAEFGEYFDNNLYLLNQELILCKPRTLDDFINDCQRAGIELTWKEVMK